MITPVFEVKQNEEFVIVEMRTPHLKVSSFDFYIEENVFKFFGKPYFLRLVFPAKLVEDGREKASYDVTSGILSVQLPKFNTGEVFADLDLFTLLKTKPATSAGKISAVSVIEQLEANDEKPAFERINTIGEKESVELDESIELDWEFPQSLPTQPSVSLLNKHSFGFNQQFTDYFDELQEELHEIVQLNPVEVSPEERRNIREETETFQFSIDHYMADFMEDEQIQAILKWTPEHWSIQSDPNPTLEISSEQPSDSIFTDTEKEQLRNLPNKEYLIDPPEARLLLLNLVDILYAFAYDFRVTCGDPNVESGWTVVTISSVLSFCDSFSCLPDVVRACLRRSLSYPLYRNWELSVQVLKDVTRMFQLGKRHIIKALLSIKRILQFSEFRAHFNRLYIDDYCIWIQSVSPSLLKSLSTTLEKIQPVKEMTDLNLSEIEETAKDLAEMSEDEE